jgi:hypothetical protein
METDMRCDRQLALQVLILDPIISDLDVAFHTEISWFDAKTGIIRSAIQAYVSHPSFSLPSTA